MHKSVGGVIRSFIAIELDHAVLRAIDRVQSELRSEAPQGAVRWVNTSGIHLTLKFLGDVPVGQLKDIEAGILRACTGCVPFRMLCHGVGCFPNPARPRVVWMGVEEPTGMLAAVQKTLEREIAPLGYPSEDRPFSPHLTLGRVRPGVSQGDLKLLGDLLVSYRKGKPVEMHVSAVSLIRSDLTSGGAIYTPLAHVSL